MYIKSQAAVQYGKTLSKCVCVLLVAVGWTVKPLMHLSAITTVYCEIIVVKKFWPVTSGENLMQENFMLVNNSILVDAFGGNHGTAKSMKGIAKSSYAFQR